jgi:hypothetical protein
LPQPFDFNYTIATAGIEIPDETITEINTYKGGVFQQAVSAITTTDQTAYELNGGGFSVYGFEYLPGATDGVCSLPHAFPNSNLVWAVYHLDIKQQGKLDIK